MADLPAFAGKFNVAGGVGQYNFVGDDLRYDGDDLRYDGHPGTAVYLIGPPAGTLMILR